MIVITYCTAQSLILQLISSDELLLCDGVIKFTVGAAGNPKTEQQQYKIPKI